MELRVFSMPNVTFLPYFGPSRRSDTTVIEITVDFHPEKREVFLSASDVNALLVDVGILSGKKLSQNRRFPQIK